MRGTLAVIDADEQVRDQVARQVEAAGIIAQSYDTLDQFVTRRAGGEQVVLVGDDTPTALGVCEHLRSQGFWLAVIAYASRPSLRRVVAVLRGGGYDYFSLPLDTAALLRSIDQLGDGNAPYVAARQRAAAARTRLAHLSPREREVLARMAGGHSNKVIGIELGISPRTVEIHRANMLSKLGACSSTEALRMYFEEHLLNGAAARPEG
ncbi:response regulator transcription factor [Alteriqipengyuania abyssalis]|uniref:response regulator transcription factor n=1 Tax=Alteriqipengyuania abyssalis TaxID=2860200 RepID=UPI002006FEEC|nr:LuxR C-terminal-related transcriptional regulator [Alteriqipengyuania abyssalis]